MADKKEMISRDEASAQVKRMITRAALVHYAFTKTLVDALGEKEGKALAKKAIQLYGQWVGKSVKEKTLAKGLPTLPENFQDDLPSLGWADRETMQVEGERRTRIYSCPLARAWQDLGARDLGRIYCYVDQAKYEAYNPELECVHVRNMLDGDPYCELAVRKKKRGSSQPK